MFDLVEDLWKQCKDKSEDLGLLDNAIEILKELIDVIPDSVYPKLLKWASKAEIDTLVSLVKERIKKIKEAEKLLGNDDDGKNDDNGDEGSGNGTGQDGGNGNGVSDSDGSGFGGDGDGSADGRGDGGSGGGFGGGDGAPTPRDPLLLDLNRNDKIDISAIASGAFKEEITPEIGRAHV